MCGVTGRYNFRTGRPVDAGLVVAMCDLIAHRGPDEAGVFTDGAIGLGHRRLSIIDLTPAGRQPMTAENGLATIVFNGEIYNFLELRRDLESRGHRFRGRSDTEILLAAYQEFGVDCLPRLRGMFAFAIWDARNRSLFVARDRIGKKPLHYREDADGIAFASEAKAFFAEPSFSASPDLEAISHYLSFQYVPSPFSAFEGVRKLPPGSYLLVQDGEITVQRYWRLRYSPKQRIGEEDAARELLERLREAVRIRLVSDVPLGAFLSGGIDSSTVVALMAELSSDPVKTYSIGFDEKEYDELPYARLVAHRYGTDHHEFIVRPDATTIIPTLVWHYDEPYADESAVPTYYLSQLTRQHVTVALNGDGGDESFSGYARYALHPRLKQFDQLPETVRRGMLRLTGSLPSGGRSEGLLARTHRWAERASASREIRYARRVMHFTPELKRRLCVGELDEMAALHNSLRIMLETFASSDASDFVDAMLDVDVNHYLPDCLLVKVDVATMAHGLEGRSPLLDHVFMEFAATLPAALKRRNTEGKYLLKRAVRNLVPAEILNRKKRGFGVPLEHWFRKELRGMTSELLLSGSGAARGLFNLSFVRQMLNEHANGTASWENQLWNLLMLEQWFQTFIDRRPSGSNVAYSKVQATTPRSQDPTTVVIQRGSAP
jgi:asparagine synthase (glutamine-hydrolysing)